MNLARPLAYALAGLMFGSLAFVSTAAYASFTSNNCDNSPSATEVSWWKRSQSQSYALVGRHEGYEWGGGCWNNNDSDDTPNAPDGNGEGGDCSGFTFKSWAMSKDMTIKGKRYWDRLDNIHGPYTAADYKAGIGATHDIGKAYSITQYMDAFASSTHIGMMYAEQSDGSDRIIEAKGDADGTGLWDRTYRSSSSYEGVERDSWDPECLPNCFP